MNRLLQILRRNGFDMVNQFVEDVVDDRAEKRALDSVFEIIAKVRGELRVNTAGLRAVRVNGTQVAAEERTRFLRDDRPFAVLLA
jgi:hypothetical protein